ncbi:MAG: DNA polymerase [Candidatus Paceibacterota bacterium]
MKTLLLIDANSLIHRCFHALPPLTAPDGRATQALYGVSNILLRILKEDKPDYAAALFDRPEPTFRKERFKEYKAQRPKAPDNLVEQIIAARDLFPKFGIKTFEIPGYEADDLIATLAQKFKSEPGVRVMILTGDLDTLQMVEGEKLVVKTFRRGVSDTFTYDEAAVKARYDLEPKQLTDYKALIGDASDNIKGVPGIGPKTASELLKKYRTLDNIYRNLDKDPKAAKKLEGTKEKAEFAKSLVILEMKAPVKVGNLDELVMERDGEQLANYFRDLGFESLVKRMNGGAELPTSNIKEVVFGGKIKTTKEVPIKAGQGSIFGTQKKSEVFETNGEILIFGENPESRDFSSDKLKVGFGLKNLIKNLWRNGKDLKEPYFDLGVAFWLLDPDFKDYEPEAVFKQFLRREFRGNEDDLKLAYNFTAKKIKEYEMEEIFQKIEMPLIGVLAEMESVGILTNISKLKALEEKIDIELEKLTGIIYKLAGEEFNINSPQQVGKIIFDKLGVNAKLARRTEGGERSTNFESLLALRGQHEIIDSIIDYREHFKIQTTYVRPFQSLVDNEGRLHTEFIQTGAATGRLSSKSPNLQNIPQGSVWAKELRMAFEAPKNFSFLAFDYSQIELRILASLSEDEKMTEAFQKGQDIHSLTASKILKIPISKVGPEERRLAKTLNFGLIYGMGVSAFSKTSGLKRTQAQDFIDAYFKEFSRIKEWQEEIKRQVRQNGYVKTKTNRRRYLPGINSGAQRLIAEAERAAINQPIQGLAADIIKLSMIQTRNYLADNSVFRNKAKMILSIHDELLLEVHDDIIQIVKAEVLKIMERVFDLGLPLKVDISVGQNLGELKK